MRQDVAQVKFLWPCLVDVNEHVAVGARGHGVSMGSCQDLIADVVHFLVQVGDMGHFHGVLDQDDVGHLEAVVLWLWSLSKMFWTRRMMDVS